MMAIFARYVARRYRRKQTYAACGSIQDGENQDGGKR